MAKILNTSTDYLLGLTNNPSPLNFKISEEELTFLTNFRKLNDIEKLQINAYLKAIIDLKEL